jgi:hypothetical protein
MSFGIWEELTQTEVTVNNNISDIMSKRLINKEISNISSNNLNRENKYYC